MAKSTDGVTKQEKKLASYVDRMLVRDYFDYFHNWKRFMWANFVRGLMIGLGTVIGATILVSIVAGLLGLFGHLPPSIGNFFKNTQNAIQKHTN